MENSGRLHRAKKKLWNIVKIKKRLLEDTRGLPKEESDLVRNTEPCTRRIFSVVGLRVDTESKGQGPGAHEEGDEGRRNQEWEHDGGGRNGNGCGGL